MARIMATAQAAEDPIPRSAGMSLLIFIVQPSACPAKWFTNSLISLAIPLMVWGSFVTGPEK